MGIFFFNITKGSTVVANLVIFGYFILNNSKETAVVANPVIFDILFSKAVRAVVGVKPAILLS